MRVLVVEDNPSMADALQRGLIAEGFDVDTSADGDDGLWRAREFRYDAIILDVMLPGMNGYVVCRSLREENIHTPIVMLTAKDGSDDETEGLDLGADDYITKPFVFSVLIARLRSVLRRSARTGVDDTITVGSLRLDTRRRELSADDTSIDLTVREFGVLEIIMRNGDGVTTRSEIRDLVWGADFDGDSNVVDVYVGYLRKKLRAASVTGTEIRTVRGVGFQMAVA